jgi:hypothetical protein
MEAVQEKSFCDEWEIIGIDELTTSENRRFSLVIKPPT